jgi:hypothetical protein
MFFIKLLMEAVQPLSSQAIPGSRTTVCIYQAIAGSRTTIFSQAI